MSVLIETKLFSKVISCHASKERVKHIWVKVFRIIPEFRILRPISIESRSQNPELSRFK